MPTMKSREIRIQQDIPLSRTMKFWEALKEGMIYTTKCAECGKIHFPPVSDCSNCLSSNMNWVKLSNEAEIETFSHVVVRPTSFQTHRPYTIAIGKLKEGVKVLAWLVGFKMAKIKVGMKAKLVAETTAEGESTYRFVPFTPEQTR